MSGLARLGGLLLALQAAWFIREQQGASRYFCWAPLHEHVWYRIDAHQGGVQLQDAEVAQRYGRRGAHYDPTRGEFWELNAAQHVIDSIAGREAALPRSQRAHVTLRYRIDAGDTRTWTYTP
jgi:hypothetical protein